MTKRLAWFHCPDLPRVVLILAVVGLLTFRGALFNRFVGDDNAQVEKNPAIQDIRGIPLLFTQGSFYDPTSNRQANNYYKPVFTTTISLVYLFFKDNPFGYHLIQIILHIANGVLVYLLFRMFLENHLSFLMSLVFLLHPINTESVVYISALQEPLFLFFGLLGLLLIVTQKDKPVSIVWAFLLFLLSLLSKETGVLFLFMAGVFTLIYKPGSWRKVVVLAAAVLGVYLTLRFGLAHVYINAIKVVPIAALPLGERLMSVPKIVFFYLKTFLYPQDLLYAQTWVVRSLSVQDFFLPLAVDLLFGLGLVIALWRLRLRVPRLWGVFLFFGLWFLVGLGLHLQIIPLDQTVADRWFYFPIVGLLGMLGAAFEAAKIPISLWRRFLVPLVLVILLIYSVRDGVRASNWRDENTLFTHDALVNTDSYQIERALGGLAGNRGDLSQAELHFKRSTELFPSLFSFNELGYFYLSINDFPKAEDAFASALKSDPKFSGAWAGLAVARYKSGDRGGAVEAIQNAYSSSPTPYYLQVLHGFQMGLEPNVSF